MCTLVVSFYPQTDYPLVVTANRDEDPKRPASPWDLRSSDSTGKGPKILCPLDVLGGTWIGCNNKGIFAAITNWDLPMQKTLHGKGLRSRGLLVRELLGFEDVLQIGDYISELKAKDYKPFNILLGSHNFLWNLNNDHESIHLDVMRAGIHISTGWGLNVGTTREKYIVGRLTRAFQNFSNPVEIAVLREAMKAHNNGIGSEHSICVHDEEHRWETRSSSYLKYMYDRWYVEYCDGPPCKNPEWQSTINLIERT